MPNIRTFMAVPRPDGEKLLPGFYEYQRQHFGILRPWFVAGDGEMCVGCQGVIVPFHAILQLREELDVLEAHASVEEPVEVTKGTMHRGVQ